MTNPSKIKLHQALYPGGILTSEETAGAAILAALEDRFNQERTRVNPRALRDKIRADVAAYASAPSAETTPPPADFAGTDAQSAVLVSSLRAAFNADFDRLAKPSLTNWLTRAADQIRLLLAKRAEVEKADADTFGVPYAPSAVSLSIGRELAAIEHQLALLADGQRIPIRTALGKLAVEIPPPTVN